MHKIRYLPLARKDLADIMENIPYNKITSSDLLFFK